MPRRRIDNAELKTASPSKTPDRSDDLMRVACQILQGIDEIRQILNGRSKSLYSVEEVARLSGRSAYTVRTWIRDGLITATRVEGTGPRGRLLIPHAELAKLLPLGRGAALIDTPIPI